MATDSARTEVFSIEDLSHLPANTRTWLRSQISEAERDRIEALKLSETKLREKCAAAGWTPEARSDYAQDWAIEQEQAGLFAVERCVRAILLAHIAGGVPQFMAQERAERTVREWLESFEEHPVSLHSLREVLHGCLRGLPYRAVLTYSMGAKSCPALLDCPDLNELHHRLEAYCEGSGSTSQPPEHIQETAEEHAARVQRLNTFLRDQNWSLREFGRKKQVDASAMSKYRYNKLPACFYRDAIIRKIDALP